MEKLPPWLLYIFSFIWGTIWGSFYNVCIYRIPNKISIISPPSHCPRCGHRLKWYDNIPILSYILLGGKCRYCGAKISPRYPLVETTTGVMSLLIFIKTGLSILYFVYFFYFGCLLVVSAIDWDTYTIPDEISIPLIIAGFLLLITGVIPVSIADGMAGALVGGGLPLIVAIAFEKLKKMENPALGGGDIKLLAAIGLFQGTYGVLFTMILGSLLGIVVGYPVVKILEKRVDEEELREHLYIPFGPFISAGAFFTYLIGVDKLASFLLF